LILLTAVHNLLGNIPRDDSVELTNFLVANSEYSELPHK